MDNLVRNEFTEGLKFDSPLVKNEIININQITNEDIKRAYLDAVERVREFEKKAEEAEKVNLSQEEKRKKFKELFGFKYLLGLDYMPFKQMSKGEISDRFFQKFYSVRFLDEKITEEIKNYKHILDEDNSVFRSPVTITIDINDVVSNPKMNSFRSRDGKGHGANIAEISKYLYNEPGKHDMSWYFAELKKHWFEHGQSIYWLSNMLNKTGTRFDAYGNGSHILNTMQIARNSGLTDEELGLPHGYIEALKNVKVDIMGNTPDDLEFILLFNNIHRLFSSKNIAEKFYIKDASKKGFNIIGVEGKDITISSKQQLIDYASSRLLAEKNRVHEVREV